MTDTIETPAVPPETRGRPRKYNGATSQKVGLHMPSDLLAWMDKERVKLGKAGRDETVVPLSRNEFVVRALNAYKSHREYEANKRKKRAA